MGCGEHRTWVPGTYSWHHRYLRHNTVTWLVARTSRKACLFFVPVAKWQREYWMYCPICSAAAPLDSKEQAETLVALALRNDQLWLPAMVQRLTGPAP